MDGRLIPLYIMLYVESVPFKWLINARNKEDTVSIYRDGTRGKPLITTFGLEFAFWANQSFTVQNLPGFMNVLSSSMTDKRIVYGIRDSYILYYQQMFANVMHYKNDVLFHHYFGRWVRKDYVKYEWQAKIIRSIGIDTMNRKKNLKSLKAIDWMFNNGWLSLFHSRYSKKHKCYVFDTNRVFIKQDFYEDREPLMIKLYVKISRGGNLRVEKLCWKQKRILRRDIKDIHIDLILTSLYTYSDIIMHLSLHHLHVAGGMLKYVYLLHETDPLRILLTPYLHKTGIVNTNSEFLLLYSGVNRSSNLSQQGFSNACSRITSKTIHDVFNHYAFIDPGLNKNDAIKSVRLWQSEISKHVNKYFKSHIKKLTYEQTIFISSTYFIWGHSKELTNNSASTAKYLAKMLIMNSVLHGFHSNETFGIKLDPLIGISPALKIDEFNQPIYGSIRENMSARILTMVTVNDDDTFERLDKFYIFKDKYQKHFTKFRKRLVKLSKKKKFKHWLFTPEKIEVSVQW